jgi:Holliday junction resolvasome RuvABC endonuclease subunit
MNIILGLDLSLNGTGFHALDTRDPNNHFGGLMKPKKPEGIERLNDLCRQLDETLHHTVAKIAVLEGYAYGPKQSRAHSTGEWGGLARMILFKHDIRTFVIPPTTLKQFVTGSGIAKKEDMKLWVFKRYKQEFKTNDECDAYALTVMLLAKLERSEYEKRFGKLNAVQQHALTKVEEYFPGRISPLRRQRG